MFEAIFGLSLPPIYLLLHLVTVCLERKTLVSQYLNHLVFRLGLGEVILDDGLQLI